ncbi:hypothetical protein STRIP9103_09667 [Streptomyces ipomoeae 91-03]|uniref:Uncharacterized protein n=1 Tax=Streptomyces ipomoeae 91-03 TaxID=698759 RepID=L1KXM6_9ACTN|nr:hypothetical protein STRIP9103_09667 [Streptomyces ipomoeae 91-03]
MARSPAETAHRLADASRRQPGAQLDSNPLPGPDELCDITPHPDRHLR